MNNGYLIVEVLDYGVISYFIFDCPIIFYRVAWLTLLSLKFHFLTDLVIHFFAVNNKLFGLI